MSSMKSSIIFRPIRFILYSIWEPFRFALKYAGLINKIQDDARYKWPLVFIMLDRVVCYHTKFLRYNSWTDSLCQSSMPDGSLILHFFDCISDFDVMYFDKTYERFSRIGNGMVIDCGANVGVFTVMAARRTKGLVIAYEPHPKNYALLLHNIHVNNLKNTLAYQAAVTSANSGSIKLFLSTEDVGHSIRQISAKFIEVATTRLDCLIEDLTSADSVSFIKLDIEGAELEAILGAKKLLCHTESIAVAAYHYKDEAVEVARFLSQCCLWKEVYLSKHKTYVYGSHWESKQ
jgi:FkbM family methyltransferase